MNLPESSQVVVIGGGQAGLAVGYYLRRLSLSFVILDDQSEPGGAWLHAWRSLQLFSPGQFSSLPGWSFPQTDGTYPVRDEVVEYLKAYEARYELLVVRPTKVSAIQKSGSGLRVESDRGAIEASVVISCTGTWGNPYIPNYPGREKFEGIQLHSAFYANAEAFAGKKVLIVGGGNSGAQILAEVSLVANASWVTREEPSFLPDDVDGRVLFQVATQRYQAHSSGKPDQAIPTLGDIVMIDSVKEARDRGVLRSKRPFRSFSPKGVVWADGTEEPIDAVIWCTGFRAALEHLRSLDVLDEQGNIELTEGRSVRMPNLWLVGYGEWTGFGSATLIGVQRYARATVAEVEKFLRDPK